ncbi:MAG: transcriptional regulator with XRE-family HTH domain [Rickettsiales bacterium]|jgi:transcriptional regulator with XRE-family HTH domain
MSAEKKRDNQIKFGEYIRNTRLALKIGLREFALKIGISATYVSKMEVGDYAPPSEERIVKMAEILKLNADSLLAMAGKISSDLQDKITAEPELYAAFLRRAQKKEIESFLNNNNDPKK